MKILVINPGSTSTKIGVFKENNIILKETINHSVEELGTYKEIYEQYKFRKKIIIDILKKNNINIRDLDGIVGRGGLLRPIEGGIYKVNKKMLEDLRLGVSGQHASNLGGILAYEIGREINKESFIVDPVVVDELEDVARISGLKEIERVSIFHALNQKAVAKRYAKSINKDYKDLNLIVAHLGGGITVGAHKKGKVVDVANGLDGEGPFSPERSGSLPVGQLAELCYSGKYSLEEIKTMLTGKGGLVSYLGTHDGREVINRINNGDKYAEEIYYAMAYQISKEIGGIATVLKGNIDGIILTGGLAYDKVLIHWIRERIEFLGEIMVYPGQDELTALAEAGFRALNGEEEVKVY